MATATVENYIKHLYLLQEVQGDPSALVSVGELAKKVGVVPGTATTMVRTLTEANLVQHEPWSGVKLTQPGCKLALRILRRHRLVELFLVKIMSMEWTDVHDEAEELEHVISEKLVARMEEMLGHPKVDLHGDPIPDSSGAMVERQLIALDTCSLHEPYLVGRITNEDQDFLRFIEENGLNPGERIHILSRNESSGILMLETIKKKELPLALSMAKQIEVEAT